MPHIVHHHHHHPAPFPSDVVPPIPPRTRTRPRSNSITTVVQPLAAAAAPSTRKTHVFRLDELPTPEQEWQLLENIGDGTYGEVFRVNFQQLSETETNHCGCSLLGKTHSKSGFLCSC